MVRNSRERSIHEADSVRSVRVRSRRPGLGRAVRGGFAGLVAAAVVAAGGYVIATHRSASDLDRPTSQASQDAQVDVLIDGWSLATLGDREVRASWDGGVTSSRVDFTAVTKADIDELVASTPEVVTQALARQLLPDGDLTCTTDGCTAEGRDVDPHALLLTGGTASTTSLQDLGVNSGLYVAHVAGVGAAQVVQLSADGYSPVTLTASADGVEASLTNGFGRGRWLVSAGLGRLFIPDAGWLGADDARAAVSGEVSATVAQDAVAQVSAQSPTLVAATGLGEPLAVAQDWTTQQLTLATSPSKGCAAGVLCYPGTLSVTQSGPAPTFAAVGAAGSAGVAMVDDRVVTVTLPAPVKQAGLAQPLSGTVSLRLVTVALFSGESLRVADWAGLVEVGDSAAYTLEDVLTHVRLAGMTWTLR